MEGFHGALGAYHDTMADALHRYQSGQLTEGQLNSTTADLLCRMTLDTIEGAFRSKSYY